MLTQAMRMYGAKGSLALSLWSLLMLNTSLLVVAQVATVDRHVRLVNGSSPASGRVEVYNPGNGTWGTVCDDLWDYRDAQVVCRMLGYPQVPMVQAEGGAFYGQGPSSQPIYLDDVDCIGNEENIGRCASNAFGVHNCEHSEDAGVNCDGVDLQVRLVNGSSRASGRVEVYNPYNGTWGTVCDDTWDDRDAQVVCRMLGFPNGPMVQAKLQAFYGQGSSNQPIYLDNVVCNGNEENIGRCGSSAFGVHNCGHGEDAGVNCD